MTRLQREAFIEAAQTAADPERKHVLKGQSAVDWMLSKGGS